MTLRCVESVSRNRYPRKDIVVVDNGSRTPGCPIIKEHYPSVETVQLDRNYGFTGGCNRGIERAFEMGAAYVFLLNNDTIVHEEAIDHLVQEAEAHPDVALLSAVLLFPGDEKTIQFYRGEMHRDIARHTRTGEGAVLAGQYLDTVEGGFTPACAVLMRRKALEQVGLFDESLFTNWEDYDLCCRLQDAGWRFLTVGKAEVIHAHGQTTGKISPFITYFFTRNRLICLFRYGSLWGILKNAPYILRTFSWQIFGYGWNNWAGHAAFAKGALHFLLGIRGDHAPKNTQDRQRVKRA